MSEQTLGTPSRGRYRASTQSIGYRAKVLHGRDEELDALRRLISQASAGQSAALVVVGAPGTGKSALLEAAVESAPATTLVLRGVGIESESELPFAALQLLLRPVRDGIDGLPDDQAVALRRALGLASTGVADRFLVGLAVLTLLSDLAEVRPVLCVVDDAQWADQASAETLLFVARRLQAEGVVMLFGGREDFTAAGLPRRELGGLDRRSALALLAEHRPGLAPSIRDRIIAEATGNPLALIELPSAHGTAVGPMPLPRRLQEAYEADISGLPEATRLLLLLVAAEESGERSTVLAAAKTLGLSPEALTPAERARLLETGGDTVRFRHPLMRAAAYNGLPLERRLAVHRALADVLSDDRRAWHLAGAATGPDERVAAELHAAAQRAEQGGAHAAAAVAYERAADLSPDELSRTGRLTAAAYAASSSGRLNRAAELAIRADRWVTDLTVKVRLAAIRSEAAFENGEPELAYDLLLGGAALLADTDPQAAALMLFTTIRIGHYGDVDMSSAAKLTLRLALPSQHILQPLLAVARTVAGWKVDGNIVPPPPFEQAAGAFLAMPGSLRDRLETVHVVDLAYGRVECAGLVASVVADCRRAGMVGLLPQALFLFSMIELSLNRWRSGLAHADEALRIVEDTGQAYTAARLRLTVAWAAAITGQDALASRLAEQALRDDPADGVGAIGRHALRILALLDLSMSRYAAVLDRMDAFARTSEVPERRLAALRIEAATRLGQPERAGVIDELTEAGGHPVKIATILRSQAMLASSSGEADRLFRAALEAINELVWPFEKARTQLLYGEWLRRARRRHEARTQLRAALDAFERTGAHPWSERARRELRASGDALERAAAPDTSEQLTPQELQIARLAAAGKTNREIAAQLFLSPKTVGHHLYRAFPKLGVASRTELARLDLD